MPGTDQDPGLREAAHELQRYLSGDLAPMMAVDSFEELSAHPAELTAKIIAHWIESQSGDPSGPVAADDLIFHALKKLSLLSELELVRRETMLRAIQDIGRLLLTVCPEAQRAALRLRLSHLGETETVAATRAEFLHREAGAHGAPPPTARAPGPAPTAPSGASIDRGARTLSLLLAELSKLRKPDASPDKAGPEGAVLAQILATAALESKTNDDLARHLDRVKKEGVATPMEQVFRALGWSLPGWGSIGEDAKPVVARTARQLRAMDRIIALAPNPQERAKRWGEMIYAAIEQLNEGRLAQAVSILEAAKQLIAERRPDGEMVGQVLSHAESAISDDLLRRLADQPAKHGLLRKVLEFFPSFRPEMLLTHLDGELRREKRKLILTLLECHGPSCRGAVINRLASVMAGQSPDGEGYYRRNLACLLRRIPRAGHDRIDQELELLIAMVAPEEPMMSAKEAVGALGELRHRSAELALVDRLRRLESEMTARGGNARRYEMADRLCAALARHASATAVRAIAAHAFNRAPSFGDALARFETLSRVDLTIDPEQLAILLKAIRTQASSKTLGFVAKRVHHELSCLMQAVSGTPAQEVRAAIEGIATQFKRHELGEQARRILTKLEPAAAKSAESLSGDLELFGLPSLLQSLTGTESSGELVLFDARQQRRGSIALARGKIARCEAGRLSGAEGIYLFMEKPFPGTFTFRSAADPAGPAAAGLDAMSLILEGARRHDEYQQAVALVADGVRFEPAGIPAVRPDGESDGEFASAVWDRAAAGATANDCELEMKTDPYRVRRLYAHWVEARALRPRA